MTKVTHDPFDIVNRIKKINPRYVVYWNDAREKFEVRTGKIYAFTVPYDTLDARTLDYARKTRIENIDAIEREIEKQNRANEIKCEKDETEKEYELRKMLTFANRMGHNVTFTKNFIKEF